MQRGSAGRRAREPRASRARLLRLRGALRRRGLLAAAVYLRAQLGPLLVWTGMRSRMLLKRKIQLFSRFIKSYSLNDI